ncbi:hypothetical protein B7P34_10800 [Streptosporangium nondiastaticum]|uniref:Uncharacterized protein n=1 Tax=Streptosporangium nondiastaticum TaxID=35764 RepID=A0A9X7JSA0_9ACTN|nr:hypothetical protein [Streptosporangium nondiastaticum]PSJ28771.1 hypothetical protein B7P34_10800 [Streptosporangium nondiastaticum]
MSEQYEYFVKAAPPYTEDRPSSLWRRVGDDWEYLSLFDWTWHSVQETVSKRVPQAQVLFPVTVERAAQLESDRQVLVRYWALYVDEQDFREGESPTTVVRRRRSPERGLDESYRGSKGFWGPTQAIEESRDLRTSNPPYLVELTADDAEALLQELFGVTGVTEL